VYIIKNLYQDFLFSLPAEVTKENWAQRSLYVVIRFWSSWMNQVPAWIQWLNATCGIPSRKWLQVGSRSFLRHTGMLCSRLSGQNRRKSSPKECIFDNMAL